MTPVRARVLRAAKLAGGGEPNRDQAPPMGYAVHVHWIGPMEGTEYSVVQSGASRRDVIAVRKSWKAACRAAWKHSEGKQVPA